ncbi:4-(cytidine 5'-diphospho)-2-C-methyl-D-erythritol kinase [Blastococcus sp. Marseille-P5729]|uniref:4-(cytidine 5'-diphospho)-2-C-methyl-D-erythritol kinase n=1 Tax=Blastococcus sp. Marseille-P5729 TaxID=2086582 RepID=UPI000D104B91|nr:4-(cytidine 5'-diphospho)-2-C-methyl-D-erythritol kinase [Blastococcus sp. Marseille-P5729]
MTAPVQTDDVVIARAPAKINLHLGVGPVRADGYHELATVFCALSLTDELVAAEGSGVSIVTAGEGADAVPADASNLACRAALRLAEHAGIDADVEMSVRKQIPVAAGLAGGSAGAAAAPGACDALWGTGASRGDLLQIAAELGSDVAFSLTGGLALGTGRGEMLSPVLAAGRWHWVLAVAEGGLSTGDVYRELDRIREGTERGATLELPDALMNALRSRDTDALGAALHNDMEPAAFGLMPTLRRTKAAGVEEGAAGALLCGSGPTMAFLARDEQHAVDLAARVSGLGVCRTVRTAYGPVPGARITG